MFGKSKEDQHAQQQFVYHEVYSDGSFIFDPRLSSNPVSLGRWLEDILQDNPVATFMGYRP